MSSTKDASLLIPAALGTLNSSIRTPDFDRSTLRPAIVHIGVGGFHRAHLATYVDELCQRGTTAWSIVGCGVLPGDETMASVLDDQDGLYTLIVRSESSTDVQVIGSIVDFIHAHPDPAAAVERIAHPDTQIVSMTITEGGYPVDDLTGEYNPGSPNAGPTSAFGIIAAALDMRRRTHGAPITVMSCDNVMGNGHVARTATMGEAEAIGPELVSWIEQSVSFPNSMVDRITPATSDSDRTWLRTTHDLIDGWPVVTEPFRQWVIEDNFAGERLPLEELDVIVTHDVEPYEFMKLRLLNAGHSCMAYLSALLGHVTVDAAMGDMSIEKYLAAFLAVEAQPVLPDVAGIDVDDYIATTIDRFRNPEIGDQIQRLCLDGTAKFPKFLLPTVRAQITAGGSVTLSSLALAGWCQYLLGTADDGSTIDPANDPHLPDALAAAQRSVDDPASFLDLDQVFDDDIAQSPDFRSGFVAALESLRAHGVTATIASTLNGINGTDAC